MIVLLAALAGAATTARLGFWQLDRAAEKTALQRLIDERQRLPELPADALARTPPEAAAQHQRRISLTGTWDAQRTVFLDNRQMNGQPGFFVITPLRLGAGDAVLVQRGWVQRDARERTKLPVVPTPSGTVAVHGRVAPPPARLHEFASDEAGPIRQNLDIDRFARELGVALRPSSVLQDDDAGALADGLLRNWPRPAGQVQKHHGYAFQWFALCALIAGLYVWFQFLAPESDSSSAR